MDLDCRFRHLPATSQARDLIQERMDAALHGFVSHIAQVKVLISDPAGPRGSPHKRCTVTVLLREGGTVVVHRDHALTAGAVCDAADSLKRTLRRTLERSREIQRRAA